MLRQVQRFHTYTDTDKVINLPDDEKINARWILDNIPLRWWLATLVAAATLVSTGYGVALATHVQCSLTDIDALRDKRDALSNVVYELEYKRASLQAKINALEIDKRVSGMSDKQLREEMKKYSRD